jgi:hypothetical protein
MKWLVAILATFLVIGAGKAQQVIDVSSPNSTWDVINTNWVANGFTNATPIAVVSNLYVGSAVNHTFQFYGTNNFSYTVCRSIDNVNWFCGATNAVAANSVAEATITGKYLYMKVMIQGTNIGGGFNYLGGR